jgi:uncharacterized protein YdeI (BOF family)
MTKKTIIFALLIFSLAAFSYNFITIKQALQKKKGEYVGLHGKLFINDFSGKYIWVKDKTGIIKVDLNSENIAYYGYDIKGIDVKVWGFIDENASGKYIRARRIQVGGHFYSGM